MIGTLSATIDSKYKVASGQQYIILLQHTNAVAESIQIASLTRNSK